MGRFRRSRSRRRGWSRREFLRRAGAATTATAALGVVPLLPACSGDGGRGADPEAGTAVEFRHGVASGDPLADRVILWTRLTPAAAGPVSGEVLIATDAALSQNLQRHAFTTDADRDYTVKVDPAGLSPGTTYYYRFQAGDAVSPVGRTRTAPAGAVERLRIGVASCASYAHGYFSGYRALARRADLDVVLHLGDYLYEYGSGEYGSVRAYEPAHEILTLDDYRSRHALYKRDADVQEVHRQHPFIAVWDDHESANDAWRDGAENHTEGAEGAWAQRKAAAIRAYAEWMPIRLPDPAHPERIFRRFGYGDLAEIVMLDTRLYARDAQAGLADAAAINDTDRQLVGTEQLGFVADTLGATRAKWKLLGQQVMFGQLRLVGLPELSVLTGIPVEPLQTLLQALPVVSTGGLIVNPDQWDGYRAERERLFDLIESVGGDNVVVLTGDIHSSWAMDLSRDPSNPLVYNPLSGAGSLAVEFVATSVTSPGLDALAPLQGVLSLLNPHIRYADLSRHGYLLLDLTPERIQGEWWYSETIATSSAVETLGAAYASVDGANHLAAATPSLPRPEAPALAP